MRKCAKKLFILGALMGAAPLALAEPGAFLWALAEASSGHPAVRAAWEETLATAEERKAADWLRYPTPSLVSQTPHSNPSNVAGLAVNRLVIEQPLYAGGRIEATIEAAQARQLAARARHAQAVQA